MSIGYDFIITTGEGLYTPVDARNQHLRSSGAFLKKRNESRFGLAKWLGISTFVVLSVLGVWSVLGIFDIGS